MKCSRALSLILLLFATTSVSATPACRSALGKWTAPPSSPRITDAVRAGVRGTVHFARGENLHVDPGLYLVVTEPLPKTGVPKWNLSPTDAARLNAIRKELNVQLILGDYATRRRQRNDVSAMVHDGPIPELGIQDNVLALILSSQIDRPTIEHEIQHLKDQHSDLRSRFGTHPSLNPLFVLLLEIRAMAVEYEALAHYPAPFSSVENLYENLQAYFKVAKHVLLNMENSDRVMLVENMVDLLSDMPDNPFLEEAAQRIKSLREVGEH